MGNSRIVLEQRIVELEALVSTDQTRLAELEKIILDPIEEKIMEIVLERVPEGKAVAIYSGFGGGWNAYVPLAKEFMTKDMALELAEEHNDRG